MKIAIHLKDTGFSNRWISYCKKENIDYKLVNCYDNDIIFQLSDCDALMWHYHQMSYKDMLFAKQLLYSVQQSGKIVFPDFNTNWHFDDKVGQKYLLEAINAPLVPSYVFYSKTDALAWVKGTTFPKVFKLRGGAGSMNVKLVKSAMHANRIIKKAFNKGFAPYNRTEDIKERIRKYKENRYIFWDIFKGFGRILFPLEYTKMQPREKGYVYFQDYIANNSCDIRVIVINNKAFAIKRMVRKNDFRASGSGSIIYEKEHLPLSTIELSFKLTQKIQAQCVAFDYLFDSNGNPLVVEVSYGFATDGYNPCVGYWSKDLVFHEGEFVPQNWMVDTLLEKNP